jgi:hypothetical protein
MLANNTFKPSPVDCLLVHMNHVLPVHSTVTKIHFILPSRLTVQLVEGQELGMLTLPLLLCILIIYLRAVAPQYLLLCGYLRVNTFLRKKDNAFFTLHMRASISGAPSKSLCVKLMLSASGVSRLHIQWLVEALFMVKVTSGKWPQFFLANNNRYKFNDFVQV